MNKDALLATVIGFGIGLVITGLVFMGPTLFKNFPSFHFPGFSLSKLLQNKNTTKAKPTPKPGPTDLTIESPLADNIESKTDLLVSGQTAPNATVVIEGESTETVVVANTQGAYAGSITLGEGKNDIRVTSYAGTKVQTQMVTVYYTPEKF
jgi:hypothetical protein